MSLDISTAEIVERFHKGESMAFLAQQYSCSRGTILYRLNQAGARSRTRAKINARVMLTAHRPVLVGLLKQLERTLELVRDQLASAGRNPTLRRKCIGQIEKLQDQIHALEQLTAPLATRINAGKNEAAYDA